MRKYLAFFIILFSSCLTAQHRLEGQVLSTVDKTIVPFASLFIEATNQSTQTDSTGYYAFPDIKPNVYVIQVNSIGFEPKSLRVEVIRDQQKNIYLNPISVQLDEAKVTEERSAYSQVLNLKKIEGTAIYASKKSELIIMSDLTANLSNNNARQAFARVPGVNVWESDAAGLQLGIGARGLSPDRTSNFNMRQNGYDIAADALGYPESYYAPPMQALEQIEIVRGAASLQYGTQFGGMVNLKMKSGPKDKRFSLGSVNTYNSVGYLNSYTDIGGQIGKLNYYAFVNGRTGSGYRPNTDFSTLSLFTGLEYQFTEKLKAKLELTHMRYLAQQAGGLTDVQFEIDPYQSLRERNWFAVNWNLYALTLDYDFSPNTTLNTRIFGLLGSRKALGFLQSPVRQDAEPFANRDLLLDNYANIGNETRLLHRYKLKSLPAALLVGMRYYQGNTEKQQGFGSTGTTANFNLVREDRKLLSDYRFPSRNLAFFAENVFYLSERISITPGLRYENISTRAQGFYDSSVRIPLTGEIVLDSTTAEDRLRQRNLLLAGIGISYQIRSKLELYANASQNYRAITFNNLRVVSPAYAIDENLQDERGFNADLGIRGSLLPWLGIDAGLFLLSYEDRIGSILSRVQDNQGNTRVVRFISNIADARIMGLETYADIDISKMLKSKSNWQFSWFNNLALTYAYYLNSQENGVNSNTVENVPLVNVKSGVRADRGKFGSTLQFTYLSQQFSDASNAMRSADGLVGVIPAFWVLDIALRYKYKWLELEGGANNITNNTYFTRRAVGYPGPGIIPATPFNFYAGLGVRF
jgi:Fe(3+) dicitrate transport protein